MKQDFFAFVRGIADDIERHAHLNRLRRLDDHLLADIGLRRDQLDSILLPPETKRTGTAGFARPQPAPAPQLEGCG